MDRRDVWISRGPQDATGPLFYDPVRATIVTDQARFLEWDGAAITELAANPTLVTEVPMVCDTSSPSSFEFVPASGWDTWVVRSKSGETDEHCDGGDADGDGLARCAAPDCWWRCTPQCPRYAACEPAAPRCGDGACSALEDAALCPADCP